MALEIKPNRKSDGEDELTETQRAMISGTRAFVVVVVVVGLVGVALGIRADIPLFWIFLGIAVSLQFLLGALFDLRAIRSSGNAPKMSGRSMVLSFVLAPILAAMLHVLLFRFAVPGVMAVSGGFLLLIGLQLLGWWYDSNETPRNDL